MSIEAMKLAVDALEQMNPYPASKEKLRTYAITALYRAIEQAKTPVGYLFDFVMDGVVVKDWFVKRDHAIEPTAQNIRPLYAAPPQREWVGLTDEGIKEMFMNNVACDDFAVYAYVARAIEVKLKEKNCVS